MDDVIKMLAVIIEVYSELYRGALGTFVSQSVCVWTIDYFIFLLWLLTVLIHVWQIYTQLGKEIASSVPLTATGQRNDVPVG